MRSHEDIVRNVGAAALARKLTVAGVKVHQSTPQRWAERDSIPGEYWKAIVELGEATLDELAEAAAAKRAASGAAA